MDLTQQMNGFEGLQMYIQNNVKEDKVTGKKA